MTRGALVAALVSAALLSGVSALTLAGCGTTTVDPSIAASADTGATTTLPPISADSPLVDLVRDLADSMRHLDEEVIDSETDDATLARIEEIWVIAEPLASQHSPEMRSGLEQSVDLARTSVERRRPADASKGYKIVVDILASLD